MRGLTDEEIWVLTSDLTLVDSAEIDRVERIAFRLRDRGLVTMWMHSDNHAGVRTNARGFYVLALDKMAKVNP